MSLLGAAAVLGVAWAASLEGVVREHGTGDPVLTAWVRGPNGEVPVGPDARFALELAPGLHRLVVGASDHEPRALEVQVPAPQPLVVFLRPALVPGEIVVEARRERPHTSRHVLDREMVEKAPGTHDDPIRLIQSLPGAALTREYSPAAGDVALRGATPRESRVMLDGIELPYLFHFQQYASVIHTRLLDELALYPSTFGAEHGDAVGGVVEVKTRPADPAKAHGGLNANFIMAGGYAMGPVGEQVGIAASGRRSYLDLVEDSNDQYTLWPSFWDYLLRTDLAASDQLELTLIGIGAGDRYGRYAGDTAQLDPLERAENPSFGYQRAFHGAVAQARWAASRSAVDSTLGFTADDGEAGTQAADQERHHRVLSLREILSWTSRDGDLQLRAGGDAQWVGLDHEASTDRAWLELGAEAPLLERGLAFEGALERWKGGVFLEPRWRPGRIWLQPGVRMDGDTATGTIALEPRAALGWDPGRDTRLRLAAGRYTQVPDLDMLDPAIGDPWLPRTQSEQASVGVDHAFGGKVELSLDLWGRLLQDAPRWPAGAAPVAEDGHAYGAELVTRLRLRDRFFTWASLALGRSIRAGAPAAYDQPLAANLVASWDFSPGWNLGLRYRYGSGLPTTPIVSATYDGNTDTWTPVPGETGSTRLPDYQKVDVHLERDFAFRRWTLAAYLEAWWVPPGANVLYPVYAYDYSEQNLVVGPPFVPLLGVRAEI